MNQHRWVFIGVFGVPDADLLTRKTTITPDNLLTLEGPACLNCDAVYSYTKAALPCSAPPYKLRKSPHRISKPRPD